MSRRSSCTATSRGRYGRQRSPTSRESTGSRFPRTTWTGSTTTTPSTSSSRSSQWSRRRSIDQEDFARAAYESIEDGVKLGNLRYREMFFNPTLHTKRGVPYTTVVDGLVDGIQGRGGRTSASRAASSRTCTARTARRRRRRWSSEVLEHRRDELIGLGMDGAEAPDPPEQFVDAYRLAGSGGLRLTAHACEDAPAREHRNVLDVLGCERIDHGYHILGDDALVERCRDEGITFTVCPTATAVCYFDPEDYTTHPIREMAARGLKIMVNSDDPSMWCLFKSQSVPSQLSVTPVKSISASWCCHLANTCMAAASISCTTPKPQRSTSDPVMNTLSVENSVLLVKQTS